MLKTPKKKKKSMLKRTLQKPEDFEAFTLNYVGYGCIEFDKNVASGKLAGGEMAAVFNLCGSPNDGEISFSFS